MSFRTNVQLTEEQYINAGEGQIGGTQGVLFIDSATLNLVFLGPDGAKYIAEKAGGTDRLVFVLQP